MKVCGIELKANNAIICCLDGDKESHQLIAPEIKKITLDDHKDQDNIRSFTIKINQFLNEMNFDKIAIKARGEKGKFAGGPISFKMEGLIQNTEHPVEIIHIATIKSKLKGIEIDTSAINKYQEEALKLATSLMQ